MGPVIFGYGTVEHIYLLAGLAALVLLIAAINFVNLAMSRAMTRTLEVGVRKAIGATRHQLSNQFLAEAIVVSLIAIVVGIGLAEVRACRHLTRSCISSSARARLSGCRSRRG